MKEKYPISCGAARRCADPPQEWLNYLHGPGETFGMILDSTYIRAMVIGVGNDKLLFVVFENPRSLMPEENVAELSRRTGIPKEQIYYFCTHNHTGVEIRSAVKMRMPVGGKTEKENAIYYEYENFLKESMFQAVDEALGNMRPARIGWATGESYINANRIQTYATVTEEGQESLYTGYGAAMDAPADRALFVLKAETPDGEPIAFLVNYAIHNVLMHRNNCGDGLSAMSGDIGGNISLLLEKHYPGSVALWSSGAAGDVQPAYMKTLFSPDPETGSPEGISIENFDAVCSLLRAVVNRHYDDVKKTIEKIPAMVSQAEAVFAGEKIIEAPSRTEEPFYVRLHLTRIGDLALMGVSGEPFTRLGFAIKEASPVKDIVLITHDGHKIQNGYTQDDESLERILANPQGKRGLPAPRFQPGYIEKALTEGTKELFLESVY